ncbi:hypothetical protein C5L14_15815 [Labrys okinawensis]|uniref:Uncharacterized protein n=1 Tax=Labrys okinawensis TaxID=346911 RepID=A0A2S9QBQ2_9HYPH|nr:hypothetical protein [Labrys okinawensis]PRH86768.1 hypothetical protein C5L14_15815 [Labrys okinawensis]
MALKDLIAQRSALAEDAIEQIIKNYVRYDPDEREIAFTPEFASLGNKGKILVYLVAIEGWSFVVDNPVVTETKPADLEDKLGIPGGSLRPTLKDLKDRHLVVSKGAGYSVRASSLSAIQRELDARAGDAPAPVRGRKTTKKAKTTATDSIEKLANGNPGEAGGTPATKEQKKRKSASGGDLKQTFSGWIAEGFFDKPKTLADVQARFHEEAILIPRTSIPKYLLAGVRDKALSRNKQDVNGKHLWVYQTKAKG